MTAGRRRPLRPHTLLLALLAVIPSAPDVSAGEPADRLLEALVGAYPGYLERHEAGFVVWKDGTRTPLAPDGAADVEPDRLPPSELARRFAEPSLRDMFLWRYPLGVSGEDPHYLADPGRIRVAAFFEKMYGDCTKGEVAAHLVPVAWLPKKKGGTVRVTRINGVAERLAAVSAELDALPTSFDRYLVPSAGAYHCRRIAGTGRASAHSTGTAIDLAVRHAHYWRWARPDRDGRYPYRNALPAVIVQAFERHGFIWGGKWYHYDTMHFEYRPEILAAGVR